MTTRFISFPARILTVLTLMTTALATTAAQPKETLVYFGTYTRGPSKGIYVSRLDLASGKLSEPELAVEAKNPGFLALHPNKRFLYAVGELEKGGGVSAFAIDAKTGHLTLLNQQSSGGAGPTHLTVDGAGKNVLVANYSGGSIACLPVGSDGKLSEATSFIQHQGSSVNPQRQKGPHAHGIYTDPASKFVFVPDLGLDKLMIYKLDAATGKLTPNNPPFAAVAPGAGPRHFGFTPNGKFAYVINEMVCTMTAFSYAAASGTLTEVQTISTLPGEVEKGFSTAEVFAHPNGKFLYGSNRGHDTIAVFAIDQATGKLKLIQHEPSQVKVPRGFGIDPTGQFLIVGGQNSDDATVFRIDPKSGKLTPTGQIVQVGAPVCVVFLAR